MVTKQICLRRSAAYGNANRCGATMRAFDGRYDGAVRVRMLPPLLQYDVITYLLLLHFLPSTSAYSPVTGLRHAAQIVSYAWKLP